MQFKSSPRRPGERRDPYTPCCRQATLADTFYLQQLAPEIMGPGVRRDDGMPLASPAHSAYITPAKLCRASGAIYPRGLIDPSGNCPWPGSWTWLHGAHLLS